MKINIQICNEFKEYLKNIDINSYINDLIAQDIYMHSARFKKDKTKFQNRLKSAIKGNTISHTQMWNKIDEL